jgi:hypothetical protein
VKVSDQLKQIKSEIEISNHRLINAIASTLIEEMKSVIPIKVTDKQYDDSEIKIKIVGSKSAETKEGLAVLHSEVERKLKGLKHESIIGEALDASKNPS